MSSVRGVAIVVLDSNNDGSILSRLVCGIRPCWPRTSVWNRVPMRALRRCDDFLFITMAAPASYPLLEQQSSQTSEIVKKPAASSEVEFELFRFIGSDPRCLQTARTILLGRSLYVHLKLASGFCNTFTEERQEGMSTLDALKWIIAP